MSKVERIVEGPERFLSVTGSMQAVDALAQALASVPDVAVRVLDGSMARDKAAFLAEAARALSFPSYFGANWDAFEECLGDLVWQPPHHHIVLVRHGDELLADAASDLRILLQILSALKAPADLPRARVQLVFEVKDVTGGVVAEAMALGSPVAHLQV